MNLRHILLTASTSVIAVLCTQAIAQKAIYYRYVDNKGAKVASSRIPSEYVKKGYVIVTFDGRVLETVPPEFSSAEKALLITEAKRDEELKQWDTQLLKRYSHPDDVEAAKQRKLTQNQIRIDLIDLNIKKIKSQINLYQSLATQDKRAGRIISVTTIETINKLERDRKIELVQRQRKRKESNIIIEEYNKDRDRLKLIRPERP
jgi:hypothetical protein